MCYFIGDWRTVRVFILDVVFILLTWHYFLGGHLKKERELLSLGHPRWVTAETTVTACGHSVLITHVTRTQKRTWRIAVHLKTRIPLRDKRASLFLDPRWFATSKDNLKSHGRFTPFWPTERAQIRESTVTRHVRNHTRQNRLHLTNTKNCRIRFIHSCFPGRWFDFTTRHVCACSFENEIRDTRLGTQCAIWRNVCVVFTVGISVGSVHRANIQINAIKN